MWHKPRKSRPGRGGSVFAWSADEHEETYSQAAKMASFSDTQTGLTHLYAGTKCASVMALDFPGEATINTLGNWWNAVHLDVIFTHTNGCESVGGLEQ